MHPEESEGPSFHHTTLDPEYNVISLSAYVSPVECKGCGGRIDVFYRDEDHSDAVCTDCGHEWVLI